MIYNFYEFNRFLAHSTNSFVSSLGDLTTAAINISPPISMPSLGLINEAYHPLKAPLAGLEMIRRLTKSYDKPEFDIDEVSINGKDFKINQSIVSSKPFCNLLKFEKVTNNKKDKDFILSQSTILIVAPLSGHYATLLRDTVKRLLIDHNVYITDWVDAKTVPLSEGDFSLSDYVNYLNSFMDDIHSSTPLFSLFAVCQPVVPSLASICLRYEDNKPMPQNLVLMGGPIDARKCPTSVNDFATSHSIEWFKSNLIHKVPINHDGAGREVYPGFLQYMGFVAMNPEHHMKSHVDYYESLINGYEDDAQKHKQFYNEYNAVADLPATYYLETIKEVFQDFSLAKGNMKINNRKIKPEILKGINVLTIEGEKDDISGLGQTSAALSLCSSIPKKNKKNFLAKGVGHYGLFSGSKWRNQIAPVISNFIDKK